MTKIEQLNALIEKSGSGGFIMAVHHYDVPAVADVLGSKLNTIVMYVSLDGSCLLRNPHNKFRTVKSTITEDLAGMIIDRHLSYGKLKR